MLIARASAPTLFVRDIGQTAAFYGLKLGFAVVFPADGSLVVLCRGGDQLHFRVGGDSVHEVRPSGAPRWHAAINVPDADALAADLAAHGVPFTAYLSDRPDGLRGFEIADPDGHILFFAHPRERRIEAAPEKRPAANSMGWVVQGWVWIEAAGAALSAVA